ncbi:hypothetical protein FJ420_17085 [Mesorhizobium sp. B3-1-3]|uniref:hypothetical protein n=1 Tax=unclassified Mesorhizobium TaxID=325217 RepID=UPI00112E3250|nr:MULTISPECIES: hypothetical protein [unclassified Mesorhizobium]TPI64273.1 hypothetical protein FJ424_18075 [Mesorhizobium sp. B3-1-8]TPI70247.1 hypothetical protein FJ420_17085 [Mesorhizobium sp. B3-1-3]
MPVPTAAPAIDPWAGFPDATASDIPPGFHVVAHATPADGPWTKYQTQAPSGAQSTMPELEDALRNADAAGDTAAAQQLADEIVRRRSTQAGGNVFDQIDAPPSKPRFAGTPAKTDPWAAFPDASAAAPAVHKPPSPDDEKILNVLRQSMGLPPERVTSEPPMSTAADTGLSFASGVPRGLVETAMFPVTLSRMVEGAGNYLYNKAENGVRYAIGAEPLSEAELARRAEPMGVNGYLYGAQDRTREIMDAVLHKPETTTGKYAGTIGEFVAPGGIPSRAARTATTGREIVQRVAEDLAGNVLAPAVTSEAAGQATEDTQYEGLSRFLGALFGNTATAAGRAYNAPESVVRRATSEMTDADWRRALGLQDNSTGIRLTGPEAIAQATGGGSALPNLLRVVEGSVDGRARTGQFFAQRPAQIDTAVGNVLDQIAPQHPQPSTLGPRAAEAAGSVVDNVRQGINAQTRPLYQAAQHQQIPQAEFAPIAADPRFVAGLARLRGNAELAPDYAGMADNSVGVIDAVTKDMAARGEALRNTANPLYGPELAARSTAGAAGARNIATNQSPEYAQALAEQERLRRAVLNPLDQGPVGRVAAAKDTAGAGSAILPQNPLTGSSGEAADASRRLMTEDPATTTALVRQNLGDRYAKASTETQEGVRDFAGAKFHKDVAGNDVRQEVLDAVLRETSPQAAASMPELLDVLQATGRRKPIGSATEFNRSMNADLAGAASPTGLAVGLARSLGSSITRVGDIAKRAALRGNLRTLADMFIDPHSVELIRNANYRRGSIGLGEALDRTAVEAGGTYFEPAGKR